MRRLVCIFIGHQVPGVYFPYGASCARCDTWFVPWPHRGVLRRGDAMEDPLGKVGAAALLLSFGYLLAQVVRWVMR